MKIVSTKLDPEEARGNGPATAPGGEAPMYGYGTKVCLDDALAAKLGFTSPPPVGTAMMMMARVEIVSVRAEKTTEGEAEVYLELQITDMGLEPAAEEKDPASSLWPA